VSLVALSCCWCCGGRCQGDICPHSFTSLLFLHMELFWMPAGCSKGSPTLHSSHAHAACNRQHRLGCDRKAQSSAWHDRLAKHQPHVPLTTLLLDAGVLGA
jgi:hypothetical protein